jgi:hypothetical protein
MNIAHIKAQVREVRNERQQNNATPASDSQSAVKQFNGTQKGLLQAHRAASPTKCQSTRYRRL